MKFLSNKLVLLMLAGVLAMCGTLVSANPAAAAGPVFPEGVRAPYNNGTFTYYLKPGNMVEGKIVRVTIGGQDMDRRRDGVWVLTTEAPMDKHWFHMVARSKSDRWSSWVKFKKVWRGGSS